MLIETLDNLTLPLSGIRLIEAGAGTGKTYTIAALYLRLILGHGASNAAARQLMPPEILVVTFTNAATEELRERIRRRLVEGAAFFRGEEGAGDDFLHGLRAAYAE
ncbi:Exodeoxyribonuclease V beta chain, partial [hydrothermal vent metagenome]